jgi:hypothetical protein
MAYEERQVEIYAAPDAMRPRLLLDALMLFPSAWEEVLKQQPPNVERAAFLIAFGRFLWEEAGAALVKALEEKYASDRGFRRKVDRAKGKVEAPVKQGGG